MALNQTSPTERSSTTHRPSGVRTEAETAASRRMMPAPRQSREKAARGRRRCWTSNPAATRRGEVRVRARADSKEAAAPDNANNTKGRSRAPHQPSTTGEPQTGDDEPGSSEFGTDKQLGQLL